MDLKAYLSEWIGKIVICKVENEIFPRWKIEREKYIYTGNISDENMREILPNEILIEFDSVPGVNLTNSIIREESVYWISKIRDKLKEYDVSFHITDHIGKSPHLRFIIKGLEYETPEIRSEYKKSFVLELLKSIKFSSDIVRLDKSFFGVHSMIIPLENAKHWKNKYSTFESIIYHNPGKYMVVKKDVVNEINNKLSKRILITNVGLKLSNVSSELNVELLKEMLDKYYIEGQRHYILAGLSRMFRYRRFDLSTTKKVLLSLISRLKRTQEAYKDLKDIESNYIEETQFHPINMFKLACGDYDSARECMGDFEKCFIKIGDDL